MKKISRNNKIILAAAGLVLISTIITLCVVIFLKKNTPIPFLLIVIVIDFAFLIRKLPIIKPFFTLSNKLIVANTYNEELSYAKFNTKIESKMLKGLFYIQNESYYRAIRKFNSLTKKCENDIQKSMVLFFIGVCYKELSLNNKAIAQYQKAIAVNSDYYKYWRALSYVYTINDNNEQVIKCLEKALELNDEDTIGYNNLAYQYMIQANYDKAIELAQKAISIKPQLTAPHSTMLLCYAHLKDINMVRHHYSQLVIKGYDDLNEIKEKANKILYDFGLEDVFSL